MIEAIQAVSQAPTSAPVASENTVLNDFGQMLTSSIMQTNNALALSDGAMQAIAAGDESDLSKKMLSIEEAKTTLSFAIEVRNKVLDAYQELMKMPI